MWELDPANGRDLIDRLRPHARRFTLTTAHVGGGWRPLVEECHERLQAAFPDYDLLAIKQKWGALEFQARPRRGAPGQKAFTAQENRDLQKITSDIRERSEHVCGWCGAAGNHRESRKVELTLCDACNERFPDPPYPVYGVTQLRSHPASLAAPDRADGGGHREQEGSGQGASLNMTAVPGCRCGYAEQAGSHRACPPQEGELPETAAI